MRCPKCKGSVPDKLTVITCPCCGAPVRRIPLTTDFRFALQVMAERNGWIFWSICAMFFWIFYAMFGVIFTKGTTARLFDDHIVIFFAHCFFTGLLMDLFMKVNAFTMRIAEKETLKRAPLQVRRFRLGTNIAIGVAIVASLASADAGRFEHFSNINLVIEHSFYLGIYYPFFGTLLGILLIGIWWAWFPYMIALEDFDDRRIVAFFYEFHCDDLGRWRRMSIWVMLVYIFGGMIAAYMLASPGAYKWLTESEFIQFMVSRIGMMFYWVPDFFK